MTLPFWFLFRNGKLLLHPGARGPEALPRLPEPPARRADGPAAGEAGAFFSASGAECHALGAYADRSCFAANLDTAARPGGNALQDAPGRYAEVALRESYDILGEELYLLAGKGRELLHWEAHSRFCSACGTRMERASDVSRRCPACGHEVFPPIAVAVIALVRKRDTALLVRARNFSGPFYGLVAGFLETGETLEECVQREIREETGIRVGKPRYFGSQPWPYPSGLMVGFVADYREGEIALLDGELSEAAFFSRDALPCLPPELSIARRMIDWWAADSAQGL